MASNLGDKFENTLPTDICIDDVQLHTLSPFVCILSLVFICLYYDKACYNNTDNGQLEKQ